MDKYYANSALEVQAVITLQDTTSVVLPQMAPHSLLMLFQYDCSLHFPGTGQSCWQEHHRGVGMTHFPLSRHIVIDDAIYVFTEFSYKIEAMKKFFKVVALLSRPKIGVFRGETLTTPYACNQKVAQNDRDSLKKWYNKSLM